MQDYQQRYLDNCRRVRELENSGGDGGVLRELSRENTLLLTENLFPTLDDLFTQDAETLASLEQFADELTKGPASIDVPLANQIFEALLGSARRSGVREDLIRVLYKLGMARYGLWYMLSGLDYEDVSRFTMRMRYCFAEASGYLKHFDEFDETTQSYILRSTANLYLGTFTDWREKLECVRFSMRVFTDPRVREAAPGLPWDRYVWSLHQQMISVIPHRFSSGELSPDAVSDVMESAHLVYEAQMESARKNGQPQLPQTVFSYYALEFRCGLISKDELLKNVEAMLDSADETSHDAVNSYLIVSLPAFYAQYLNLLPEQIAPRRRYIAGIYDRMVRYIENMRLDTVPDQIILYLRQSLSQFIEVDGGVSYRDFAEMLLRRFSPDLYRHGTRTGLVAEAVCRRIMRGEPGFFDEIPELIDLGGEDKVEAAAALVTHASLLHDLGKINFASLYNHSGRQYLAVEDELMKLHTTAGYIYLRAHKSTEALADAAYGTHRYYDSSGGYPEGYRRGDSPYRMLVDLIVVADFLTGDDEEDAPGFDERIAAAIAEGGRRFSPLITAWLRDHELIDRLREICGS